MNTILRISDVSSQRIHYRVMILDENDSRSEELEVSFLMVIEDMQDETGVRYFEKAKFFFVQNSGQLENLPNSMAFNMIWIHVDFPNAVQLAEKFYSCNPFCYIVFYGNRDAETILSCLHARPIAFVRDITSHEAVHKEMQYVWAQQKHPRMVLRLYSRNAFYDVAVKGILYCQSAGRKTYIFVDSTVNCTHVATDDVFVRQTKEVEDHFSYVQNIQLDEIQKELQSYEFIRVHQSFLVNRLYVKGLSMKKQAWFLILADSYGRSIEIPVSERYRDRTKALFNP